MPEPMKSEPQIIETLKLIPGRMPRLRWAMPSDYKSLSWAIIGGGLQKTNEVIWLQVRNADLPEGVCPKELIRAQFLDEDLNSKKLILLTSAYLDFHQEARITLGDIEVQAIATTGLGNALRAGDPVKSYHPDRTINLACRINKRLSDSALIEALAIMTEAKTAAIMEGKVLSRESGLAATGTGTDCQAVLCPDFGPVEDYAGKHTAIGSAIGQACFEVIRRGIEVWNETEAGRAQRKAEERELSKKGL
jgi:adenosylcobinamide amidohydrolase